MATPYNILAQWYAYAKQPAGKACVVVRVVNDSGTSDSNSNSARADSNSDSDSRVSQNP